MLQCSYRHFSDFVQGAEMTYGIRRKFLVLGPFRANTQQ